MILTLVDENYNYITIVAVIDNQVQRLFIEESIKYKVIEGKLNSDEEIIILLKNQREWTSSLQQFDKLRYSKEHFNVYYYVSQAESVHFLKNTIANRKDSMNVLLNTSKIDGYAEYIANTIIGKSRTRKGVLINDAITSSKEIIDSKIYVLQSKMKGINAALNKIGYEQLLEYPVDVNPVAWDIEKPNFDNEKSTIDLTTTITEINALHYFVTNSSDYEICLNNERINALINDDIINDFIDFFHYVDKNLINKDKISESISEWNRLIDIYNHSSFFRSGLDVAIYKKEDLFKLREIKADLVSVNVEELSSIITSIKESKKALSTRQNMLYDIEKARAKLYEIKNNFDKESSCCPFCNHKYNSVIDLEHAFNSFSYALSGEKDEESQKMQSLNASLQKMVQKDSEAVLHMLHGYDEQKIHELNSLIMKSKQFIGNEKRIKNVETVYSYLHKTSSWAEIMDSENPFEIKRVLQGYLKSYMNPDFANYAAKYDFKSIFEKYKNILVIQQPRIIDKKHLEQKIQYMQYLNSLSQSTEINVLRDDIKRELLKMHKLKAIRDNFEILQNIYQSSINDYKNQILKKLRVPLLIYTGKILQDYQNGLGVFVSKDEMRFVSNGDAKHDILNTFSSGQLSGFVLAFLFSMNKQYILKSADDIGFILIDDPVQTMDDINVSSLIEVLRNDFSKKQIIISTHETDKENYILYKFLKYNSIGQSFNVKEKLYL